MERVTDFYCKKIGTSVTRSDVAPQVRLELTTLRLTAECSAIELLRNMESGNDLLSQAVSHQVPSAQKGLTTVFGMRTGGSPSPSSPEIVCYSFVGCQASLRASPRFPLP